jgi:Leucine-rich repeat (LRR) protein
LNPPLTGAGVTVVQVSHNQLSALPPELGRLGNLKRLFVSRGGTDGSFDLTPITRSQASGNELVAIPAEIGQLTRLEWLSVRKQR